LVINSRNSRNWKEKEKEEREDWISTNCEGITDHWEETAAGPGQHSPSLKYRSGRI
jgi:hypothetical protein